MAVDVSFAVRFVGWHFGPCPFLLVAGWNRARFSLLAYVSVLLEQVLEGSIR